MWIPGAWLRAAVPKLEGMRFGWAWVFQGAPRSRSLNLAEAPGESGSPGSSRRRCGVSHRRGLCAEGGRGAGAAGPAGRRGTGAAVLSLPPRSHHGVSPARPALSRSHQQMQPLVSGDPDEKSRRDQGSAGPVSPLASPSDSSRSATLHGMSRIACGAGPGARALCVPACAAGAARRPVPGIRLPRASQHAATLRWDGGQRHLPGEGLSRMLGPVGNPASCPMDTA